MATRIGVIGAGYWGPNLIRNVDQLGGAEMVRVADLTESRRDYISERFPKVDVVADHRAVLDDDSIDGVIIATPASTHRSLAGQVLEAGKHCYVEKPLTRSSQEANELIALSKKHDKVLMVGHTFLYTPAVQRIKAMVDSGELGNLQYLRAMRVNLGLFQKDINVLWDLAPHDISILLYITGRLPRAVWANGQSHVSPVEDVASVCLEFDDNLIAYIFSSWLDPHKQRYFTVVGDKKMLIYDDVEPQEKLRIYDRGVEAPPYYDTYGEFAFSYRYGDIVTPMLKNEEPLRVLVKHFIDCCETGAEPRSSGLDGLNVVKILEACDSSLKERGARIDMHW